MIKSWYLHVREETMAPARMVSFIEEHAISCDVCRLDPDLKEEISRITELILPESKIPKAVRQKSSEEEDIEPEEDTETEDDIETENDDVEDIDEEEESDDSLDEEGEDEEELDLDDDI